MSVGAQIALRGGLHNAVLCVSQSRHRVARWVPVMHVDMTRVGGEVGRLMRLNGAHLHNALWRHRISVPGALRHGGSSENTPMLRLLDVRNAVASSSRKLQ